MKSIMFFIPTLTGGGAEKVLVNLVNNMDASRFDITVTTLFDIGVNKKSLNENIKYETVFKKSFRGNTHILKIFSPKFLYNKMVKKKYDIVVSYLQSPVMRIVSGCTDKDTKLVSWMHNEFHSKKELSYMYRSECEFDESMSIYDKIVFVARSAQDILCNILPEIESKSCTIYNTVESDVIKEKSEEAMEKEYSKDEINLISVGRFAKAKAFDRLISCAKRLRDENIPVHLYLLGDGALRSMYEELIKKYDVENYVTLLGYRQNPYKYVKNADLFVCSSLHEGFSTAVTESLIVGTPVVTTTCSGMEELLGSNGEYGIITENNEDALFDALVKLLKNKEQLKGLAEKATERGKLFYTDRTVSETEKFFEEL